MIQDLPPRKDPKGGSPKTPPGGIPYRDYSDMPPVPSHSAMSYQNGSVWKMAASALIGINIGLVVALFTALSTKGVTQSAMETYVDKMSSTEKQFIGLQQSNQERALGVLSGQMESLSNRVKTSEEKHISYENSIADLYGKLKLAADYLEEERKGKR